MCMGYYTLYCASWLLFEFLRSTVPHGILQRWVVSLALIAVMLVLWPGQRFLTACCTLTYKHIIQTEIIRFCSFITIPFILFPSHLRWIESNGYKETTWASRYLKWTCPSRILECFQGSLLNAFPSVGQGFEEKWPAATDAFKHYKISLRVYDTWKPKNKMCKN